MDILPHLLLEHQTGFVNRTVEATYRARTYQHLDGDTLTGEHAKELDRQAEIITRYTLFADEAKLPKSDFFGSEAYKKAFRKNRKPSSGQISLKDFDLKTRIFRYRCSYMIYNPSFMGMPSILKDRVYSRMKKALDTTNPDPDYFYLTKKEKEAIIQILTETLEGWK